MGPVAGRPTHIARYEILGVLGQGSMGVVYQARDPQLDRLVALKTLRPELGLPLETRTRFEQEARAAGRLSHPGIVAIHDVIDVAGVPYIVMEYVDGRTLAELIARDGPLAPDRAIPLIRQVCASLAYAHAQGVVHRDVKPGNVLVTADGVTKLSDFGIARIAGGDGTRTGVMLGTPAYMTPEQLRGAGSDARSDLFALGVVLYETLTGVHPFQADDLATTLYQIAHAAPVPASERNPQVSPALTAVLARALAKEPDQRYASATALADALEAALGDPRATAPQRGGTLTPRRRSRRRLASGVVAACVLVGSVAAWTLWARGPQDPREFVSGRAPRAPAVGWIVVSTNPSVDVFVDGTRRERAGDRPVVLDEVPVGDRQVTLRFGTREHQLRGTVRPGQTVSLTYYFPDERMPSASRPPMAPRPRGADVTTSREPPRPDAGRVDGPREEATRSSPSPGGELDGLARKAQDTIREVTGKVNEGVEQARRTLERTVGRRGEGGGPPASGPSTPRPSTSER